ncbi:benzaldehyde dehydrogenase [Candidatus Thalassolituus haligoni]|uniref:benzaldehyde dehydrogenase n=1 Tax=Candidatus Thalassolituus haligoni TaxID=3100113 RepID=UPI0035158BB6
MTSNVSAQWDSKLYLGSWVSGRGEIVPVIEPATGNQLGMLATGTKDDIDDAARIAKEAQVHWAALSFDQRAAIMRKVARQLEDNAATINNWNVRECGSIPPKAEWELHACIEQAHMAAALPMHATGAIFPSSMPGRRNYWKRIPIGVVGVIAPWNFPILLGLRSVLPALAMGNAVILKPDVQSAVCGGLLLAELFEAAGIPKGVFQVVPGAADTGDALVRHPDVKMISFTGSTPVGRQIGEICGRSLKKVSLELGGNNAMVILDDADLESAASCAAWGAFLHQGQICMQTGRHLVQRKVAQRYAELLAGRAANLAVGNPATDQVHLGPLINDRQAARVGDIVNRSVALGAQVLAGGKANGRFFQATVLADVTPDMPAWNEEIFGPVAPIMVFDTEEEAIALVNSSEYGLAVAVHSQSESRALSVASKLRAGMVHINDQTVNNEFQVPFGGMGASGNGSRFGGPANIEEFTETQWVSVMGPGMQYPF